MRDTLPPVVEPAQAPVTLSPWDALARSFAQHIADTHARMAATWGNLRQRTALAEAALATVQLWVTTGEKRLARWTGGAADLPAALLRRTERAKAAEVHVFTFWPTSLLRAVRRGLAHVSVSVSPVEVVQTVGVSA